MIKRVWVSLKYHPSRIAGIQVILQKLSYETRRILLNWLLKLGDGVK